MCILECHIKYICFSLSPGILRPLSILASSAYRNCSKNACLSSALSSRHFSHIQTLVVSSAPRLITSVRNLTCGQTATVLNRVVPLLPNVLKPPVRTVTYYSSRKGKRKTVKAVIYRFLRLHSGLWLRRKAGYKKKLWKKTVARKRRLREFVFCNKTQTEASPSQGLHIISHLPGSSPLPFTPGSGMDLAPEEAEEEPFLPPP
ncbi:39S ribosomal protein L35, mitochondrial isoform X3 [Delphinapterus leucas]|uniref:Large ribosomal subunit protein bL35m n=1 Tax=Delphinapterus leucas TaxID=9749 RepID=A0A7F8KIF5_DELLE|nr:39S ribosomal protein L35, mitochondrial isoform X3 [Delphinapterus leucas]